MRLFVQILFIQSIEHFVSTWGQTRKIRSLEISQCVRYIHAYIYIHIYIYTFTIDITLLTLHAQLKADNSAITIDSYIHDPLFASSQRGSKAKLNLCNKGGLKP